MIKKSDERRSPSACDTRGRPQGRGFMLLVAPPICRCDARFLRGTLWILRFGRRGGTLAFRTFEQRQVEAVWIAPVSRRDACNASKLSQIEESDWRSVISNSWDITARALPRLARVIARGAEEDWYDLQRRRS